MKGKRVRCRWFLLGLLLAAAAGRAAPVTAAVFPLRGEAVSDFLLLDGEWLFRPDPDDRGVSRGWFAPEHDTAGWERAPVPGVWAAGPGEVALPVYTGRGWYRRRVTVPADWDGTVRLWFFGAMHAADLWVDGRYQGVHRGGYTPFYFDLSGLVAPGGQVLVAVRVDNTLSAETVPAEKRGWQNYGGLYREVYLAHLPRVRPADLATAVRLDPAADRATLTVTGVVRNESDGDRVVTLEARLEAAGRKRAGGREQLAVAAGEAMPFTFVLPVSGPRLWHPGDPFLHRLVLAWNGPEGVSRALTVPVGLREVRVSGGRLLLNGEPLWLQGFGQHEDRPGHGPLPDPAAWRSELELMKKYGANTLRAGHYPYHPLFYGLCDELGLLVFTEIPAWQNELAIVESDAAWEDWLAPQLTAMVRSLRLHPSVFAWGVSNEIRGAHAYFRRAGEHVRALDPTRPVTAVLDSTYDPDAGPFIDFWARNFHYGWYHSQDVYALREHLDRALATAGDLPIWVAEVGGLATRGRLTGGYGDQSRGSETYLDKTLRFGLQYPPGESERIAGVSVWTFRDFHHRGRVTPHGIHDRHGHPKLAAWSVRNLFAGPLRAYLGEETDLASRDEPWRASIRFFNPDRRRWPRVHYRWVLVAGTVAVDSGTGTFAVDAGTRAGPVTTVAWSAGPGHPDGLYSLWAEFRTPDGQRLHTNVVHFDLGRPSQPGLLAVSGPPVPVSGGPFTATLELAGMRVPVYDAPGLLLPLPAGDYRLVFHLVGGGRVGREVTIEAGRRTELALEADAPATPGP